MGDSTATKDISTSSVTGVTLPSFSTMRGLGLIPQRLIGPGVARTIDALAGAHNKVNGHPSQRANPAALRAVYRRGAGSWSRSKHPGRTRRQHGMARVRAHLATLATGTRPDGYTGDGDLLPIRHPLRKPGTKSLAELLAGEGSADDAVAVKALELKAFKWEPDKHPRGKDGRWIHLGAEVESLVDGKKVRGGVIALGNGKAKIRDDAGTVHTVKTSETRTVANVSKNLSMAEHTAAHEKAARIHASIVEGRQGKGPQGPAVRDAEQHWQRVAGHLRGGLTERVRNGETVNDPAPGPRSGHDLSTREGLVAHLRTHPASGGFDPGDSSHADLARMHDAAHALGVHEHTHDGPTPAEGSTPSGSAHRDLPSIYDANSPGNAGGVTNPTHLPRPRRTTTFGQYAHVAHPDGRTGRVHNGTVADLRPGDELIHPTTGAPTGRVSSVTTTDGTPATERTPLAALRRVTLDNGETSTMSMGARYTRFLPDGGKVEGSGSATSPDPGALDDGTLRAAHAIARAEGHPQADTLARELDARGGNPADVHGALTGGLPPSERGPLPPVAKLTSVTPRQMQAADAWLGESDTDLGNMPQADAVAMYQRAVADGMPHGWHDGMPGPPPEVAATLKALPDKGKPDATGSLGDPIAVGGDLDKAARLLSEGKHVRLEQPDELATLIGKVNRIVETSKKRGADAPTFDFCKISVPGTNLFCQQSKGIPRAQMPQLKGTAVEGSFAAGKGGAGNEVDVEPEFLQMLQDIGVKATSKNVLASHLRASQAELDGAKVAGMAGVIASGSDKGKAIAEGKIFTTRDGYVIDGHHRWAAMVAQDIQDGQIGNPEDNVRMNVVELDMDIGRALDMTNEFARRMGIAQKSVGAQAEAVDAPGSPGSGSAAQDVAGRGFGLALHEQQAELGAHLAANPETSGHEGQSLGHLEAAHGHMVAARDALFTGDHSAAAGSLSDARSELGFAHEVTPAGSPHDGVASAHDERLAAVQELLAHVPKHDRPKA